MGFPSDQTIIGVSNNLSENSRRQLLTAEAIHDLTDSNNLGKNWTQQTVISMSWCDVCYGNGIFVAIKDDSGGVDKIMVSIDSKNWTNVTLTGTNGNVFKSICYANGLFVLVGDKIFTSLDGFIWTERINPTSHVWQSVCYGTDLYDDNNNFVAVSSIGTNDRVMTSSDGIVWETQNTSGLNNSWTDICFGNGRFVVVGIDGEIMSSIDGGINWSGTTITTNYWSSVVYGNGKFVAVSNSGANRAMVSTDGINWTTHTAASLNDWNSICFVRDTYIAVSETGTNDRIMTSSDGITWASQTTPVDNAWKSVTYGNGILIAVAQGGTADRVMVSGSLELNEKGLLERNNVEVSSFKRNFTSISSDDEFAWVGDILSVVHKKNQVNCTVNVYNTVTNEQYIPEVIARTDFDLKLDFTGIKASMGLDTFQLTLIF